MTHQKKVKQLEQQVADLQKNLADANSKSKHWFDEYMKEMQGRGRAMGDSMERAKLEKTLEIVGHITAGRGNDAIQKLLEPLPVVFSLDVRFADDKSRLAAEDELLEKTKNTVITAVQNVKFVRKAEPAGE